MSKAKPIVLAPAVCSLCVENLPDKSPSPMELNRIAFACRAQHSLDDHIDHWPLYSAAPALYKALVTMIRQIEGRHPVGHDAFLAARRAIKKAEGR